MPPLLSLSRAASPTDFNNHGPDGLLSEDYFSDSSRRRQQCGMAGWACLAPSQRPPGRRAPVSRCGREPAASNAGANSRVGWRGRPGTGCLRCAFTPAVPTSSGGWASP
eukprot:2543155-Pyramimonas_sp.AAC.1